MELSALSAGWERLSDRDRKYVAFLVARLSHDPSDEFSDWMTVAEAAKATGYSTTCIRRAIEGGDLVGKMPRGLTRGWRIRRDDLLAWMGGGE